MLLIIILFFALAPSKTPAIKGFDGKILVNSIANLQKLRIGGIDQTILIRGNNIDNPIILFYMAVQDIQ